MHNLLVNTIKATIIQLIVALFITVIIFLVGYFLFGARVEEAISLISKVSIDIGGEKEVVETVIDEQNKLKNYPEYGTKYGELQIDSLDVDLPLYYGDTLSILRNGIGHSSGSYFPGEGGTIVCMAHNTRGFLYNLSDIEIGAEIVIETTYGTFTYEVYDTKVVPETQVEAAAVQNREEILILYTCFPTNTFGHATERFMTYSKLVDAQYNAD